MKHSRKDLTLVGGILEGEIMPSSLQDEVLKDLSDKPFKTLLEISTGALQLQRRDFVGIGGRLAQAALSGNFKRRLAEETKKLQEDGKIPPDEILKEKANFFQTFRELLDFIDGAPDERRFMAMKDIFIYYLSTDDPFKEEEAFYFMKLINSLETSPLITLCSTYKIFDNDRESYQVAGKDSRYAWCEKVAIAAGHSLVARIQKDEDLLVKEKLLSDSDGRSVDHKNFRLTDLAIRLCEFMTEGRHLVD